MTHTMYSPPRTIFILATVIVLSSTLSSAADENTSPCPISTQKLFTPNKAGIQAEIRKLTELENDMRGTVRDLDKLSQDIAQNRLLGRVLGYREAFNQTNRAVCAAANLANEVGPTQATTLTLYSKACRTGENIADGINEFIDCLNGDCFDVSINKLVKGKSRDVIKMGRSGINKAQEGDTLGAGDEVCSLIEEAVDNKIGKIVKESCRGSIASAKAANTVQIVQDLNKASEENNERIVNQKALLNAKIGSISDKVTQLSQIIAHIPTVDWNAMIQPEPNMTPIHRQDCEETTTAPAQQPTLAKPADGVPASPEDIEKALSQLSAPSLYTPGLMRSRTNPSREEQAEASADLAGTASAILKGLGQAIKPTAQHHEIHQPPKTTIVPRQPPCVLGFNCPVDLERARQDEEYRQAAQFRQRQLQENEARLGARDQAGRGTGQTGKPKNSPAIPCVGCGCGTTGRATC